MIPLSALDLATVATGSSPAQALRETTDMARWVEHLGYRRLWVAEHHAMVSVASSAPAVLSAHLASATTTLRVGAGGVMLPNHAPLVIAEQFATLEALHPGRIDLGLGRAPGTDALTARALRRARGAAADTFPDDVVELLDYFTPNEDPSRHPQVTPGRGYAPQVWLLGSSTFSAQLAGFLGLPFSFAYHFAPPHLDEALVAYRTNFRPSPFLEAPHVMVAVSVLCAPSEEEARWLAGSSALTIVQRATGRVALLSSPHEAAAHQFSPQEQSLVDQTMSSYVIGEPSRVRDGLVALARRSGADELLLSTRTHSYEARARSFELVARAWEATRGASASPVRC